MDLINSPSPLQLESPSCGTFSEKNNCLSEPCDPAKIPLCPPPESTVKINDLASREERAMSFLDTQHLCLTDPREKEYSFYESKKAKSRGSFRSKTVIGSANKSDWKNHKFSSFHDEKIEKTNEEINEITLTLGDVKGKKKKPTTADKMSFVLAI